MYARHGRELMGCESPVRKPMVCIYVTNATKSTSRRQGRFREEWSEGSPRQDVRADGQKSHREAQSPGELARHNKIQGLRRQGKCGGCARTVHVLIRGDLSGMRQMGRVSAITWNPEAPEVETPTVSRQKSAEGIVGLLTEGPNEEVRRGHL